MKVIFLDIDGVLNCQATAQRHRGVIGIDPYLVAIFNRIIFATEASIVLSSTWRLAEQWRQEVRSQVMDFIDITPRHPKECGNDTDEPFCNRRGCEIEIWLKQHPEVERYAIIDDDSDMLPEQLPNFFKTTWQEGLTEEVAQKVIAHLTRG